MNVREAFCNWNNIAITLYGDRDAAMNIAMSLGNKLMYQTSELLNEQNLPIITNSGKLSGGATIDVMIQHGLRSMKVFAPYGGDLEPKYRERKEIFYWPAFEVYDEAALNKKYVGLVICRGGGFNPPYEFIPVAEEDDIIDSFWWGKWTYNYNDMPFDSVEDYLKPKLFFEEPGIKLYDMGAAGTQNEVYDAKTSTPSTSVIYGNTLQYWVNEFDKDRVTAIVTRKGNMSYSSGYYVPEETKNNPDYDIEYPDYIYMHDHEPTQGGPKYTSGLLPYSAVEFQREDDVTAGTWSLSPEGGVAEAMSQWGIYEFAVNPDDDMAEHGRQTRYLNNSSVTEDYEYGSEYSSAVDDSHYFFLTSQYTWTNYTVGWYHWTGYTVPPPGGWDTEFEWDYEPEHDSEETDPAYVLHCSGTDIDITSKIKEHTDLVLWPEIRYYDVGGMEFFILTLYCVDYTWSVHTTLYFYYTKAGGKLREYDVVAIEGYYREVPEITDKDENALYNVYQAFRLVKEEKIIKEKLNPYTGLWEEI